VEVVESRCTVTLVRFIIGGGIDPFCAWTVESSDLWQQLRAIPCIILAAETPLR